MKNYTKHKHSCCMKLSRYLQLSTLVEWFALRLLTILFFPEIDKIDLEIGLEHTMTISSVFGQQDYGGINVSH